jgi:hypothetical protein
MGWLIGAAAGFGVGAAHDEGAGRDEAEPHGDGINNFDGKAVGAGEVDLGVAGSLATRREAVEDGSARFEFTEIGGQPSSISQQRDRRALLDLRWRRFPLLADGADDDCQDHEGGTPDENALEQSAAGAALITSMSILAGLLPFPEPLLDISKINRRELVKFLAF